MKKFLQNFMNKDWFSPWPDNKLSANDYNSLSQLLPYRAFDSQYNIYINNNSYGFIFQISPLIGASESTIKILTGIITDGIPDDCTVQFINWASPKTGHIFDKWVKARQAQGDIYSKMATERINFLKNIQQKKHLLNSMPPIREFKLYIVVGFSGQPDYRQINKLVILKDKFVTTLKTIGIYATELMPDQFINLIDELINPNTDLYSSDLRWDKNLPLNMQMTSGEMMLNIGKESIIFRGGEFEARSLSVRNFPECWAQWENQELLGSYYSDYLNISVPFLSSFSFHMGNHYRDASRAAVKSTRLTQQAGTAMARFVPSILELDREWQFVMNKINNGQKLVKSFYQTIIYAPATRIDEAEQEVKSLYKANGWRLERDKFVQLQSWLAALPFALSEGLQHDLARLGRTKTMVTWSCANIAPLQGECAAIGAPRLMLIGRRGQPLFWNPFDNDEGNYNVAVIGKSGSGKSVFMQELVASLRGSGGRVIVIDDGRSFMNSSILQNGEFIEFSGQSNLCLNPFSIINSQAFNENESYKSDVIHLITMVVRQMCKVVELTNDVENSYISQSITAVWQAKNIEASISDVADYLARMDDKRAHDLAMMIQPYTKEGVYASYFEGKANIAINNPLMVFELAELKGKKELQSIVMMLLMFIVSEAMYNSNRGVTTSLVIDEAWDLLHGNSTGKFIEGLARRARKYNGNLITGTQSVNDYYKNSAAQAAFENTDWVCFLAQKPDSIEQLKKTNRIIMSTEMEKVLKSLKMVDRKYSEIMIYGPMGFVVGRLILDPFSLCLFSSKGEDFAQIKALQQAGHKLIDAIEILATKMKNNS